MPFDPEPFTAYSCYFTDVKPKRLGVSGTGSIAIMKMMITMKGLNEKNIIVAMCIF